MGPGFLVSIAYIDPGNCKIPLLHVSYLTIIYEVHYWLLFAYACSWNWFTVRSPIQVWGGYILSLLICIAIVAYYSIFLRIISWSVKTCNYWLCLFQVSFLSSLWSIINHPCIFLFVCSYFGLYWLHQLLHLWSNFILWILAEISIVACDIPEGSITLIVLSLSNSEFTSFIVLYSFKYSIKHVKAYDVSVSKQSMIL